MSIVCSPCTLSLTSTIPQAYDDRIQRAQLNKRAWDNEREKRNKEREEWARQAKERSEARMKARTNLYENIHKIKEEKEMHGKLVEQFYQELCDRNPEWEIRKQEVLKVVIFLRSSAAFSHDRPSSAERCERRNSPPDTPPVSNFLWPYFYIPMLEFYIFRTCCTICSMVVPFIHFYSHPLKLCPLRFIYFGVHSCGSSGYCARWIYILVIPRDTFLLFCDSVTYYKISMTCWMV